MKSASRIMYTIGRVFNIINLVISVLVLVLGIVAVAIPADVAAEAVKQGATKYNTPEAARNVGIALMVIAVLTFAWYLVVYLFAKRASKAINGDLTEKKPHIIMIIFGALGDMFYLLGGIFGLVVTEQATEQKE